jgi:hypothetical protein
MKHRDTGALEHFRDVVTAVRMPVVVAENGDDRNFQRPACVRDDGGLFGLSVRRQVPREQKKIRPLAGRGESFRHFLASGLVAVDVAGGGNADPKVLPFHQSVDEGTPHA